MRYELPTNPQRSLWRVLLIWGLPILGWVTIIVAWIFFAGTRAPSPNASPEPATSAPSAGSIPSGQGVTPTAQVSTHPTGSALATNAPASSSTAPTKQEDDREHYSATPYDFAGAVSHIGLMHENGCATGILVDPAKRKVLWAKLADKPVPIASMTKMMTLLLAEEAIQSGLISRQTVIPVSVDASKIGGSQVWLDPRESFPFSELLKAVAIKSANDAAYLVGEYLGGGDINAFISKMNRRAKTLGMTHTIFYDTHGLGDATKRNNLSSAHDMVLLGEQLLAYPEIMRLASTRMDTLRNGKTELKNHNNLVFKRLNGVDGLKTGYTRASGFCVTFSCRRGGRRLLGCVTGFKSAKERDLFCSSLLAWGYTK